MKKLALTSAINVIPLYPVNRLAPTGYGSLIEDWLKRSPSVHTRRVYKSAITSFFAQIAESEPTPELLAQFLSLEQSQAFELVSQYQGKLIEQKLAPATINRKLAAIKSLVSYATECRIGDRTCLGKLRPSESFFCPAGVNHRVRWEKKAEFTLLIFNPKLFEEELEIDQEEVLPFLSVFNPQIQFLINTLKNEVKGGYIGGSSYGDRYALTLIHEIHRQITASKKIEDKNYNGLSKIQLQRVQDLIQSYLDMGQDLNIPEVAKTVNMSQSHFSRLFKESTGSSPHKYYDQKRMERARQSIISTSDEFVKIAQSCGFSNAAYFSRWFCKRFYMSPRSFRNKFGKT